MKILIQRVIATLTLMGGLTSAWPQSDQPGGPPKSDSAESKPALGGALGGIVGLGVTGGARQEKLKPDQIELLAGMRKLGTLSTDDTSAASIGSPAYRIGAASNLVIRFPNPKNDDAAQHFKFERVGSVTTAASSGGQSVMATIAKAPEQTRAPAGFDLYQATITGPISPGEYTVRLKDDVFRFRVDAPPVNACNPDANGNCRKTP